MPVHIGGRALDILICLAERPGEVVSKRDLVAAVWTDVTVDEGSLRFHVSALRKALGDGQDDARYVTNVPGRGYCLVAPVESEGVRLPELSAAPASARSPSLPPRLGRLVGRDEVVGEIEQALLARRFVTIVGAGGIGKTTIAVAVAHRLVGEFRGEVHFVDLGQVGDARLVASALASALGQMVSSADPLPSILAALGDKRLLLIFDSCEHVIESIAEVAESLFAAAPNIHMLATSREALRVEGEQVHRLAALDGPPCKEDLTAAEALSFPAAQLFVERVSATASRFELADADAPAVAEICRKLDGIALAIELAAGGVDAYGLRGIARLLDNRFGLFWRGRRTARPRHQTLTAMLDWSYNLLSPLDELVLRRLSVFVGPFTLDAAQEVAAATDIDRFQVVEAVASLVAKSLVTADRMGTAMRYRLLDTTRAYAFDKLVQSGEANALRRQHAIWFQRLLQALDQDGAAPAGPDGRAAHRDQLGNIRAALEWSFSEEGDLKLGTALAAVAVLFFLEVSLLTECHRWTERAIAALDQGAIGSRLEMELLSSLGVSLMFTLGNKDEVRAAFARGLELAEAFGDRRYQMRLLRNFHIYLTRIGDFHGSLEIGRRSIAVAREFDDADSTLMAEWMLGVAHHLIGHQRDAVACCESAMTRDLVSRRGALMHLGYDHRIVALVAYARALWLRGFPDQAAAAARFLLKEAERLDHPVTLCISLVWSSYVFLWIGDWQSAGENIERLLVHAAKHSLGPYHAVGVGLQGELAVAQGDLASGIALLQKCLDALQVERHQILTTVFETSLAAGLAQLGRVDEAAAIIERALGRVGADGETVDLPEIFRVRGEILAASPHAAPDAAEASLRRALDLARGQAAQGWVLRSAMSLAGLWQRQERHAEARALLVPVFAEFAEGMDTADLRRARALLQTLDGMSVTGG